MSDGKDPGPVSAPVTTSSASLAAALVQEHRERWRRGERIPVELYLERSGLPRVETTTLLDMVYNEVLLREEDGESPDVQEYLDRFPAHAEALRDQFEVHRALRTSGTFAATFCSTAHEAASEPPDHATVVRLPSGEPLPEAAGAGSDRPTVGTGDSSATDTAEATAAVPDPRWPQVEGFKILGKLGSGGMGTVYLAFDRKSRRRVALKTMNRAGAMALLRFKSEFRQLLDVAHPNLATLHELLCDHGNWILSMELLDGVDFLRHVRGGASRAGTALPPEAHHRLKEALRQLSLGVQALHSAGKLHRDIKPSNVMVSREGRVVLLDFGLAAEQDEEGQHLSTAEHLVGTAAYMAPEQAGGQAVSVASDWYSVGVMLFEALTGQLPFQGGMWKVLADKQRFDPPSPTDLVGELPDDLNILCRELLHRDPQQRPSGAEILRRLERPDPQGSGQSECSASAHAPARARSLYPRLVGRERHQVALAEALSELGRGRPVVVFLEGSSGSGKTALLQSFLDESVELADTVVLAGRCFERESVPYKALDSLIDELGRYLGHLDALEVASLLPRDVGSLARVFPSLRRVHAVTEAPRRDVEALDPQELRRRAFAALRELLARLGDRRRLILAVDDLQWGDADSVALLVDLFRPPDAPVLLFLAAYRSEDRTTSALLQSLARSGLLPDVEMPSSSSRSVRSRKLYLEPLSTSEAQNLASSLLGEPSSSEVRPRTSLLEGIARESGGNPFFLVEMVRYFQADATRAQPWFDFDRDEGGRAGARPRGHTLDEMLLARIGQLPAETRDVLQLICIAGRPLRIAELAGCTGPAHDERVSLSLLRNARLVRSTGRPVSDEVEAYHDRIREAVVAHLDADLAREYHRRLARVLEASGQVDPEVLATHFLGANQPALARDFFLEAADQAAEALAFERSARLYRCALELAGEGDDPGRVRIRLGDALANAGRGREAAEAYLAAVPVVPGASALGLLRLAAMQFLISGHMDEGLETLRTVLRAVGMELPATPRRALMSLLWQRACLAWRGYRFRQRAPEEIDQAALERIDVCWSAGVGLSVVDTVRGADFQARGLLLALRAGEPSRIARALAMEAAHAASMGGSNRRRVERLLGIAEGLGRGVESPYALGIVILARGVTAYLQGRWTEAQRHCDQAEAIFRDRCTGAAWEINTANAFSLWGLSHQGEIAELSRRWPILLSQALGRGNLYAAMNLSSYLMSIVKLAANEPIEASEGLRETSAKWSRQGYHVQHNDALWAAVQIELYLGHGVGAWNQLERSWPLLRRSLLLRVQFVRTSMQFLRARAALAAAAETRGSHPAQACRFLTAALRAARGLDRESMPCARPYTRMIEGSVAAMRGDRARALSLLEEARSGFDAAEMRLCSAAARRRRGELLGGEAGQAEVRRSEEWMAAQGIQDASRMASMILTDLR
jgi:tetratricopeptide (TPR) repeat protein